MSQPEMNSSQISDEAAKHLAAWRRVFKKWDWLEAAFNAGANLVLLGCSATTLYDARDEPVYLILLSMVFDYTIAELGEEALLDCLQEFDRSDDGLIKIRDTKITLNIYDAVEGHADHTNVSNLSLVLRDDHTTGVLYYKNCDEPQHIETEEALIAVVTRNGDEERMWTSRLYRVELSLCPFPRDPGAWYIKKPYPPYTSWLRDDGEEQLLSPYPQEQDVGNSQDSEDE